MAVPGGAFRILDDAGRQAYRFARHYLGNTASEFILRSGGPEALVGAVASYHPLAGAAAASTLKVVRQQLANNQEIARPGGNVPRPSAEPKPAFRQPIPGVLSRTTDLVTSRTYHGAVNKGKIEDSYNTKTTTNNYYSTYTTTNMPRYYNPRRRYRRRVFRRRVRRVPYSRRRLSGRRFITVPKTMQTYGATAMRAIGQLKYVDEDVASSDTITANWFFEPLGANIAQGTSMITRIGNRILIKKIMIRGQINMVPATTGAVVADASNWVKLIIVLDTQNNATDNSTTMAASGGLFNGTLWDDFRNLYRVGRYRILHESVVDLKSDIIVNTAGTDYAQTGCVKPIEIIIPCNIIIEYNQNATTGAITTMPSNAIYLGYVRKGGTANPVISYASRIRYKDLQ